MIMQTGLYEEKFKHIEKEMTELKNRVSACEQTKEILIELKVLSKEQAKANEQRDAMLQDQARILAKNVQSLECVITNQKELEEQFVELNEKVDSVDDKGKIDSVDLLKGAILFILGAAGTYILQALNLFQ